MDKRHLFGMAAALLIAAATPAVAVDNAAGGDVECICMCDLGADRPVVMNLIYRVPAAAGCDAINGRTCNVDDPNQPGLVRSGRVAMCDPTIEMHQSVIPGDQGGWVADPGTGQGRWGGQAGPLLNGTFEQQ